MPNGTSSSERSFFRPKTVETGRHESYEQAVEGEYVFRIDRGGQSPFDTYNEATKELQGIIRACLEDNKSSRAHGSLWSLSTVAVTNGRLIDNTALRLAFEVPSAIADPAYSGDAAKLRFVECGNSVAALNDYKLSKKKKNN